MRRFALLIVLLMGCGDDVGGSDFAPRPGQDEAIAIVWFGEYGKNIEPPAIDWVHDSRLSCRLGQSFPATDGTCAFGEFTSFDYSIHLAVTDGQAFSKTSFAHELCHAKMWVETNDADGLHLGPCFAGTQNLVGSAQVALMRSGL